MDTKDKAAYLAKLKEEEPEKFIRLISNNLNNNKEFSRKMNSIPMERILGREDWHYVIYNFSLDKTHGKAVFYDDFEDAMQTYGEMAEKGVDKAILLLQVSPQLAEALDFATDTESIQDIAVNHKGEYKVIACNKHF